MNMNEKGQSTIEFLMTFIFAFAFLIVFLRTALNITNGFMVQYATFLASRTYMVWDNNSNNPTSTDQAAATRARETFEKIPLSVIFTGTTFDPTFNDPSGGHEKVFNGVYVEFENKMNLGSLIGGDQTLNLISESFLLREPVRSECLERICVAMTEVGATECKLHITLEDNGC